MELRLIPEGILVCKRAFCIAHDIGETTFHRLVDSVKKGHVVAAPQYSDRSSIGRNLDIHDDLGRPWSISLNREQLSAMVIPNSSEALYCFTWLDDLFRSIGDHMPNINEIHLDSVTVKKQIYGQYAAEHHEMRLPSLKYSSLVDIIWNACFPYVKIRQYKVTKQL